MGYLVPTLTSWILLSSLPVLAQLPVVPLQRTSLAATGCSLPDPSGSNSLYARWIASVQPSQGISINATNPWVDCVAGRIFTHALNLSAATYFTNQPPGMFTWNSAGGPGGSTLTNSTPLAPGTNSTVAIVLYPFQTTNAVSVYGIYSPYNWADAAQAGHPAGLCFELGKFSWSYAFEGGTALSSVIIKSNWYDVVLVQSNTTVWCYTNGVLSRSVAGYTPPAGGWPWEFLGWGDSGNSQAVLGWIPEILIWSNVLSATAVGRVHAYSANQYQYPP